MKCMKCGKDTFKSTTTNVTDLGDSIIVVRNVPCYKCDDCDEVYYTADVVKQLEKIIDSVKSLMQDVAVIDFSKAA